MKLTFLTRFEIQIPDDQVVSKAHNGDISLTFNTKKLANTNVSLAYLSSLFLISNGTKEILWFSLTQSPKELPYFVNQILPADDGGIEVLLSLATPEEVLVASQLDNLVKARDAFSESDSLASLTKSLSDLMLRIRKDYPRVY